MPTLQEAMAHVGRDVDRVLETVLLPGTGPEGRLADAMRYATLGGGKRLRPFLVAASADLFDVPTEQRCIVEKMVEGSVQKFLKDVTLLGQPFVKNDKQTVEQMLKSINTQVAGFTMYVVGEGIEKKVDDFAAEVAAQVAAAKTA